MRRSTTLADTTAREPEKIINHIEFHNVSKRFENGAEALHDVSVAFDEGSMTFLTGHSGAGKSTFLRLLLRLDRPSRGQILVNEVNIGQLAESRLPRYRQQIGAVFQDHHLLGHRSVFDNVALPLRVAGMREREAGRRVRAALSAVSLLEKERLFPGHLSTGEQQRVGIARAVVNRPRILLADEPTGNLDPELSRDIMDLFRQFHRVGTTVIVASHDQALIESMGVRIVVLTHGQLENVDGES
jgi:cell division transport system ATP-binding protein